MNLIRKIFSKALNKVDDNKDKIFLIDVSSLMSAQGKGGSSSHIGQKENIELLRALGQFASREALNFVVIVCGKPLREIADGGKYKTLVVYYADKMNEVPVKALELMKKYSQKESVVLITDFVSLEKEALKKGYSVMRCSTLKKGIEESGDVKLPWHHNVNSANNSKKNEKTKVADEQSNGINSSNTNLTESRKMENSNEEQKRDDKICHSNHEESKSGTILNFIDPV